MKRTTIVFGATAVLIFSGALLFRPSARADAPRVPEDGAEVLERLPTGAADPRERENRALRSRLAADPGDLGAAVALSRLYIETSRARSDPRYLGYAQAALAPWWDAPRPPPQVLVLRATIRQSLHEFEGALADLERVVAVSPEDAQAWITRSVVLAVLGRYDEAKVSCQPLARLASELVYTACEASIDGVSGSASQAYQRLEAVSSRALRLSPEERAWAASTLGEIALRLGRDADAERSFRAALTIDPNDSYVLATYADLLLDLGRFGEVIKLLSDRTNNDNLLLRLALAEKATGSRDARAHTDLLADRYRAAHLRGDAVHQREEARFELGVRGDATASLTLSRSNFDVQREPADVRVLLEAALAAHQPAAATAAIAFVDAHHLEDPRIAAAIRASVRRPSAMVLRGGQEQANQSRQWR